MSSEAHLNNFLEAWSEVDVTLKETDKAKVEAILDAAKRQAENRDGKEFDVMMHPDWLLGRRFEKRAKVDEFLEKAAGLKDCDLIFCLGSPAGDREEELKRKFNFRQDRSVRTEDAFDIFTYARLGTGYLSVEELGKFLEITQGFHPDDRYRIHGGEWNLCQTHAALQLSTLALGKFLPAEKGVSNPYENYKDALLAKVDPTVLSARLGISLDYSGLSRSPQSETAITRMFHDRLTQVIV